MVDLSFTKNFFYYGKYTVLPKAEIPRVAFRIKNVNKNIKEFSFFPFFLNHSFTASTIWIDRPGEREVQYRVLQDFALLFKTRIGV